MVFVCPECGQSSPGPGTCPADRSALALSDDDLLGQMIGSYRVTRLLGQGGMGTVYKAVQPNIGARVAIKVLSNANRELVDRFFSEARAVNVIRHEQIVNVLDLAFLPDGRPYIVMEYLDGLPLSALLKQRGRLPLGTLAQVIDQILDALSGAHGQNIVHRDLKPDNVFISPAGKVKVLDFGIAKLDPGLSGQHMATRTGSIMGTPPYMSPEQAMAKKIDGRADLYSVGIMLYEGAVGHVPFMADSLFEILRQHLQEPPAPPRSLRPEIPPAYEAVILRALAKEPAERFASAEEMAQALAAATQGLPPSECIPLRTSKGVAAMQGLVTPFGSRVGSSPGLGREGAMQSHPDLARPPTGAPLGSAYPTPLPVVLPTPPPLGQLVPAPTAQPAPRRPRSGLWLALGFLAIAGVGAGVTALVLENPAPAPLAATPTPPGPAPAAPTPAALPTPTPEPTQVVPTPPPAEVPAVPPTWAAEPPAPEPPAPARAFEAARFEASAYLDEAQRLARVKLDDAELVRLTAQVVAPDGHSDLTQGGYPFVQYSFRSTTRSQRGGAPPGTQLECQVDVFVAAYQGLKIETRTDDKCDEKIIGWPRCSLKQVWDRARRAGAPRSAAAMIQWMTDANGTTRWLFSVGDRYTKWLEDDCTGDD